MKAIIHFLQCTPIFKMAVLKHSDSNYKQKA